MSGLRERVAEIARDIYGDGDQGSKGYAVADRILALLEGDEEPVGYTTTGEVEMARDGSLTRLTVVETQNDYFSLPLYTRPSTTEEPPKEPNGEAGSVEVDGDGSAVYQHFIAQAGPYREGTPVIVMDETEARLLAARLRGPTTEEVERLRSRYERVEIVGNEDGWVITVGEWSEGPNDETEAESRTGYEYSYISHVYSGESLPESARRALNQEEGG